MNVWHVYTHARNNTWYYRISTENNFEIYSSSKKMEFSEYLEDFKIELFSLLYALQYCKYLVNCSSFSSKFIFYYENFESIRLLLLLKDRKYKNKPKYTLAKNLNYMYNDLCNTYGFKEIKFQSKHFNYNS